MGRDSEGVIRAAGGITFTVRFDLTLGSIETDQRIKEYNKIYSWLYPPDTLHMGGYSSASVKGGEEK